MVEILFLFEVYENCSLMQCRGLLVFENCREIKLITLFIAT